MDTFPREEALGSGRFELYQVVLGIDSSGFRVRESLFGTILLFLGTVSLLFLGTELLLFLGTVGFGFTRCNWLGLGSWIQWRRLSCNGEVTFIIYTISLGVSKETKKSIKVGAVEVYDTNLVYSRVIGLQANDRPVDIADLLAHELARVPSPLYTDSGELRTASAKSVMKTNTAQLLSARRAQENVDVIVIDGSAYLWIPPWPASGTIQHYIEKFKYHRDQMYSLHLTDTKSTALREPLEQQEALVRCIILPQQLSFPHKKWSSP